MSIAESDVNANVNDESLDLRCKLIVRDVFAVQLTAIGYIYALERDVILVKLVHLSCTSVHGLTRHSAGAESLPAETADISPRDITYNNNI